LTRPQLAVVASAAYPDLRPDWPILQQALDDLGITATTAVWTDPTVRWADFDLVVASGAWDNIHRPDEFLQWADQTAQVVPMVNSPATLRWNLDKHYLSTLAEAGVATVPTVWCNAADESAPNENELPPGELVVKPTISGGGFQTARYRQGERAEVLAHIRRLHALGRDAMVQPYEEAVDTAGEAGLIFLAGRFSHAIHKTAMLRLDIGPQSHLLDFMDLGPLEPSPAQLEVAEEALAVAEDLLGPTTYARVDLVPLPDGSPAVLELELLDPALFFEIHPDAAPRYAHVLAQRIASAATDGGNNLTAG
jgi:hypothetical protein